MMSESQSGSKGALKSCLRTSGTNSEATSPVSTPSRRASVAWEAEVLEILEVPEAKLCNSHLKDTALTPSNVIGELDLPQTSEPSEPVCTCVVQ